MKGEDGYDGMLASEIIKLRDLSAIPREVLEASLSEIDFYLKETHEKIAKAFPKWEDGVKIYFMKRYAKEIILNELKKRGGGLDGKGDK